MVSARLRRWWDHLLAFGAVPGETDFQRGKRRIVVGYFVFGALVRLPIALSEFAEGFPALGLVDLSAALASALLLSILALEPKRFVAIVNVALFLIFVEVLAQTILLGGIVESELVVLFGLLTVIGALIVLPIKAAFYWFLAYLITLVLAVVLPERIEPVHVREPTAAGIAFTIAGVLWFVFPSMAYFVRQRDRFQQRSDDLLLAILPDEIAERLKSDRTMIADDHESASVLFADVVGFTPMSAAMSPPELVSLLNSVFTTFDRFVEELGLEKIETVGDAYMVASGVPHARPDHAHAIAELALRMRDHTEHHPIDGHRLRLRLGINSGPVVAGVVGTHKFAYDLWGDVVNTASRMESEGIPGSIQVTPATHELIRDGFVCEPRGTVSVKGKGDMDTYILVSRR
jgi:adenylate cyclase